MSRILTKTTFCCLTLLMVLSVVLPARAQNTLTISVPDSYRPVADAVNLVETKYGYPITYEDPKFVFSDDMRKKGALSVNYEADAEGWPVDPEKLIRSIVEAGSSEKLRFDFWQGADGAFHVVPVSVRNREGRLSPHDSLLDTRISIPAAARTGEEFFVELCAAITRAGRGKVILGGVPHELQRTRSAYEAKDELVRDILTTFLPTVTQQLSWHFLCEAGPNGACGLNVYKVPSVARQVKPPPSAGSKPRRTSPFLRDLAKP